METYKNFAQSIAASLVCLEICIRKGYQGYDILMPQEFTVTDDTVLEEHMESPDLVQMRILGEGGVCSCHQNKLFTKTKFIFSCSINFERRERLHSSEKIPGLSLQGQTAASIKGELTTKIRTLSI